jgi:hypothetical protein
MNEHVVAIVSFDGAVKREAKRVRKELQRDETLHSFGLRIDISGRVHDGDLKLKFTIGDSEYFSQSVTGDSLQAVIDEFMRRRGWTAIHSPKALGYETVPSDDSDIPF